MAGPAVGVVFTPFPVGEMPEGVEKYEAGTPHGRVRLMPVEVGDGWLRDEATGKKFGWRPADCGLDCFCAAEAWWISEEPQNLPNVDGEVVVELASGWSLRSSHDELVAGGYVRLCRPDGSEHLVWDSAEWSDDPELVMGAIICAAGGTAPSGGSSRFVLVETAGGVTQDVHADAGVTVVVVDHDELGEDPAVGDEVRERLAAIPVASAAYEAARRIPESISGG